MKGKKRRSGIQNHTHNQTISASGLEPSSFIIVYIMPVGLCFRNSQPQSFATWVLSPPARGRPDGSNFCYTHCLDEISLIHTPAPQGNSGRYGYSANYCDRGRGGQYGLPQMAVSEFSQGQIGPLPLFAGNRSRPWSTSYQLRFWWHMQVWGYVWFLIFANSDRVVLDSANFTVLP